MKVIFSRKGFDWSNGNSPSPVMPDGTLLSIPIPSNDNVSLDELFYNEKSYADIMEEIRRYMSYQDVSVHLDPDIRKNNRSLPEGWVPAFGQNGAAESHLENEGVGIGDLFLFFGWFSLTKEKKGVLKYDRKNMDLHIMWGYLQVGKIARSVECLNYPWHPHCFSFGNNTIYEASEKLMINGVDTGLPGSGCLKYSKDVVLTKPGETRSRWLLPDFFKEVSISCHTKDSFKPEGYFQTVKIGQEFVVSEDERVSEWAKNVIINNYDDRTDYISVRTTYKGDSFKTEEEHPLRYSDKHQNMILACEEAPFFLDRDKNESDEETYFKPMRGNAYVRPAQIPIRKSRMEELKKGSCSSDDGEWMVFCYPERLMVYSTKTGYCVFDAAYIELPSENRKADEEDPIAAVVTNIYINQEEDQRPEGMDEDGILPLIELITKNQEVFSVNSTICN